MVMRSPISLVAVRRQSSSLWMRMGDLDATKVSKKINVNRNCQGLDPVEKSGFRFLSSPVALKTAL